MDLSIILVTGCPVIVAPGFDPWFVFVLGFRVVDWRFIVLIVLTPVAW